MRAVVVYESLWGNTAAVARAIAEGIGPDAQAVHTGEVSAEQIRGADLLVAGAPVFAFHLSDDRSRHSIETSTEPGAPAPDLSHPSLRSWLAQLPAGSGACAAFDTQVRGPFGSGAPTIAKALQAKGYTVIGKPQGFYVEGRYGPLRQGELERARQWGGSLGGATHPS